MLEKEILAKYKAKRKKTNRFLRKILFTKDFECTILNTEIEAYCLEHRRGSTVCNADTCSKNADVILDG